MRLPATTCLPHFTFLPDLPFVHQQKTEIHLSVFEAMTQLMHLLQRCEECRRCSLSLSPSLSLFVCLSVCLCLSLFLPPFVYLVLSLFPGLALCGWRKDVKFQELCLPLSVCLSAFLPACLSVGLLCLSVGLSLCVSIFLSLSVCLSVSVSLFL